MTMNSHRPNKRKITSIAIATILIILFSVNYKTEGLVSNALRSVVAPLWNIGVTMHNPIESLKSKKELKKEIESLRSELQDLRNLQYENLFLRAQNNTLLTFTSAEMVQNEQRRTLAQVLGRAGVQPYGTLLVASSNSNVRVGSIVLGARTIALGNVSSVSRSVATVRLFSAAERSTAVTIGTGEEPIAASAIGVGNGNFVISIPRDANVNIGDPVFAAGAFGYTIAIVGEVERDPASAFTVVRGRVPFNIQSLRRVLIKI